MACDYCEKERDLLSGEDWRVFIRGNRLVCTVDVDVHDYKEISICPGCGESLTEPVQLTLEELGQRNNPVWVRLAPPYINDCKGYWCLCQEGHITPPSCMPFMAKDRPNWTFYDRPPKEPSHDVGV